MKNLLKPSLYLAILVATACLFYACSDEELSDVSTPVAEADFTVRAKNGYLEFKDQAAFDEVKASLENMDREALDAWESQFDDFTSLRSIDEQSVVAQEIWFEELRKMPESERIALSQADENFWYSGFVKEHKAVFALEDSGKYHLNIAGPGANLVNLLNKDGIYQVGSEIRVYQENTIKTILDGDDSKISMLSKVEKSDESLQIDVSKFEIMPVKDEITANGRESIYIFSSSRQHCSDKEGRNVISGNAYVVRESFKDDLGITFYVYALYLEATNFYKDGIFGGYTRKRTRSLRIKGSLDFYVDGKIEWSTSVDYTTGGKLRTKIEEYLDLGGSVKGFYTPVFSVTGSLDVYGRSGTLCGDSKSSSTGNHWR